MMPQPQTQGGPPPGVPSKNAQYSVKPGDTWESISAETGVPVNILQQGNPDIDEPQPGDILNIPTPIMRPGAPPGMPVPPFQGAAGKPVPSGPIPAFGSGGGTGGGMPPGLMQALMSARGRPMPGGPVR